VEGCAAKSNDVTIPKLPPPPRIAQNRSGFRSGARAHHRRVREDQLGADEVVERQAVFPDLPADAARQRQPADPDALGIACRDGQSVRGQGGRDRSPGGTAADPDDVPLVIDDLHRRKVAEIDHDTAVVGAESREAVAAAAHGQHPLRSVRESHPFPHVFDVMGPEHEVGPTEGEQRARRRFVVRRARRDDVAAEVMAEVFER
jgi:hypothetical protein